MKVTTSTKTEIIKEKKVSDLTIDELKQIIRDTIIETIGERIPYTPYPMCPQPFYYKPPVNPWDDTYKVWCSEETETSPCGSLGHKHSSQFTTDGQRLGD